MKYIPTFNKINAFESVELTKYLLLLNLKTADRITDIQGKSDAV